MRLSGYFIFIPLLLQGSMAGTAIYRCNGDFGEPVFRHRPCGDSSSVYDGRVPPAASEGVGLRAGEKAWLRQREQGSRRLRDKKRRALVSRDAGARAEAKQAYQCRRKRRSLDGVKAKLRRGYKPASGEKLRRRRRDYEDYLSAFCP